MCKSRPGFEAIYFGLLNHLSIVASSQYSELPLNRRFSEVTVLTYSGFVVGHEEHKVMKLDYVVRLLWIVAENTKRSIQSISGGHTTHT